MSTTTIRPARNGVDTPTLFATIDAVKQAPAAAKFQFRAHNEWVDGTHSRSSIGDYFGVGEERSHERTFVFDADPPAVLVGNDHGPTPVEFVLHALASCLTAGLANGGKIDGRMLVDNIGSQGNVDGVRDALAVSSCQDARLAVAKTFILGDQAAKRLALALLPVPGLGLVWMTSALGGQALHDRWTGTYVVRE